MNLLDLITEIQRYCVRKGLKMTQITVSDLTNDMIAEEYENE